MQTGFVPSPPLRHPALLHTALRHVTAFGLVVIAAAGLAACDEAHAQAAPTDDRITLDARFAQLRRTAPHHDAVDSARSQRSLGCGPEFERRIDALESKEEIRSILLAFSRAVDGSDPAALSALAPKLHREFVLDAVDFEGHKLHFEGLDGVIAGFGPIMVAADANLMPSAIDVTLDGDTASASFKFANSVKPPPQLGLDVRVKVLLFAANAATFVREDGAWKLLSIELVHSLAYPGALPS